MMKIRTKPSFNNTKMERGTELDRWLNGSEMVV